MLRGGLFDADDGAELERASEVWETLFHEAHDAARNRVKGVVLTCANVGAGTDFGTALANQDFTRQYFHAIAALDAKTLGSRISAVCCGALGFFMCHMGMKAAQVGHLRGRIFGPRSP